MLRLQDVSPQDLVGAGVHVPPRAYRRAQVCDFGQSSRRDKELETKRRKELLTKILQDLGELWNEYARVRTLRAYSALDSVRSRIFTCIEFIEALNVRS